MAEPIEVPVTGNLGAIEIPHAPGDQRWMILLTAAENRLIGALRADPDLERHIVDCREREPGSYPVYEVTVRHPVSERVHGDDLFECPVLLFAETWLDDEENPVGRWRHRVEHDDFERIQA